MISTSARPKSSMRITSGSISMRPNSAPAAGSTVQRRISGTNESSSAPRITPQMLPMPPSTTIDTTMIDSTSTKLSGLMKAWIAENMPPATPPKLAPMAKASSFRLRVLMPIARAAISSSRIASQARPMREFCSRRLTTMTASTTQQQQVVVLDRAAEVEAEKVSALREAERADAERIDARDALRAVGDVHRPRQVVEEDADDLAEAERDDGEVVAAQLERRRAEQHAEERGDQRRRSAG